MMKREFEAFGSPEIKVISECAEVIHAITKAKDFGWRNYHPDRPDVCNAQLILSEIDDARRAFNMLEPLLKCFILQFKEAKNDT